MDRLYFRDKDKLDLVGCAEKWSKCIRSDNVKKTQWKIRVGMAFVAIGTQSIAVQSRDF